MGALQDKLLLKLHDIVAPQKPCTYMIFDEHSYSSPASREIRGVYGQLIFSCLSANSPSFCCKFYRMSSNAAVSVIT